MIGRERSYTLQAEGQDRTRVIHDITMEPQTTLGRLTAPFVGGMGSNMVMPLLKQLKEAIEQQPTTTA
jgi:hypothetical protein